jgi:hypothetical protein
MKNKALQKWISLVNNCKSPHPIDQFLIFNLKINTLNILFNEVESLVTTRKQEIITKLKKLKRRFFDNYKIFF